MLRLLGRWPPHQSREVRYRVPVSRILRAYIVKLLPGCLSGRGGRGGGARGGVCLNVTKTQR